MTNEKAIDLLSMIEFEHSECCLNTWYKGIDDDMKEALDMAIKALSQDPCEDCISRAELLKAIDTWDKFGFEHTGCFVREPKDDFITYIHYDDVVKCIKGLPSVSTEKTGRWIKIKPYPLQMHDYECSECGHETDDNTEKHCSECGCRILGVKE